MWLTTGMVLNCLSNDAVRRRASAKVASSAHHHRPTTSPTCPLVGLQRDPRGTSELGQGRLWPVGGWHSRSTPSSGNAPCVPASALRAMAQSRCAPARCAGARAERPEARREDNAGQFESAVLRSRCCQPHSGWSSHERHYHCQSAASAHDRGHDLPPKKWTGLSCF